MVNVWRGFKSGADQMTKSMIKMECLMHSTKGDPGHVEFYIVRGFWIETLVDTKIDLPLVNLMDITDKSMVINQLT